MQYNYTACVMVLGPHDTSNLIVGETQKVQEYWDSIEDSIDYEFYHYETKEDMEQGIKEVISKPTPFVTWMLYQVEDCVLGECPPNNKGADLGNPATI